MSKDKYVAYVGTYTHGSSIGIHVYDLDVENGYMTEREVVPVNNASHVAKSNNGKYLYSIADEGVEVLKIKEDGGLEPINKVGIDGMRGCFLSTDKEGKFLFVCGYHDGKITVVRIKEDGSLGEVLDGIFHQGLGSVAERNFRPRVTCAMITPDDKYLCVVDNGIDQIKVYTVNQTNGKLKLYDIIRCELESGPRLIRFSRDGRFAYVNCELTNEVLVYAYDASGEGGKFEQIQKVDISRQQRHHCYGCASSGTAYRTERQNISTAPQQVLRQPCLKFLIQRQVCFRICILPISGASEKILGCIPG